MKSNCLYILRNTKTNAIYAISEYQEWIAYYIELFEGYFNDIKRKEYTVDIIRNQKTIDRYLNKYHQDYYLYPRGINNHLVLTEWEWTYYKPFFKELYEKAKDTIINLHLFHDIYKFNTLTEANIDLDTIRLPQEMLNVSYKFYDIASNFDTFMEHLSIAFVQTNVLVEPIKAHKFNQFLQESQLNYYEEMYWNDENI